MIYEKYLEKITQIQAEIATLGPLAPENQYRLWQRIRLDWNYHSNSMEGNTLTRSETETLIIHGIHAGNKYGRHYEEITLHNEVLLGLQDIVRNETPITEHLIRGLHTEMMGDEYEVDGQDPLGNAVKIAGQPGKYKSRQNYVQRGEEKYYYSSVENVEPEMRELIDWLREEEEKNEKYPIEIAADFHLRFLKIHPFDDGNGRIARILMNMILMKSGLAPAIIQREEKPEYLTALVLAQDGNNKLPLLLLLAKETYNSMKLRLKAYRGESLERMDDWEKEVELLKQQVAEEGHPLFYTRTLMNKAYYASVDGLFQRFYQKMNERFSSFFSKEYPYGSLNQRTRIGTDYKDIKAIIDDLMIEFLDKEDDYLKTIYVQYNASGFKKQGYEEFAVEGTLEITFNQFYYFNTSVSFKKYLSVMHKKRVKGFMFKYHQKRKPLPYERRNIHEINNGQNI